MDSVLGVQATDQRQGFMTSGCVRLRKKWAEVYQNQANQGPDGRSFEPRPVLMPRVNAKLSVTIGWA